MPELPEVEFYRRLAERALHRPVAAVHAPDAWYLKGGADAAAVAERLVGRSFTAARRVGKLLLLDVGGDGGGRGAEGTLGLRFGMTGRLLVDGLAAVDRLLYSGVAATDAWDRFRVRFHDGGDLRVRDPRRLGGVLLDADEATLGPDAASVSARALAEALAGSGAPLKARLMDQRRLAGVGNLLADEVLWRAGLAPARPAGSLRPAELRRLHRHLTATLEELVQRGGSHTGDLVPARLAGGCCPRDGTPLRRSTVGGRTTWWCPRHQR